MGKIILTSDFYISRCGQCGVLGNIKIIDKVVEEEDTKESVVYKRNDNAASHL
jgi:hypothetical protein